MRITFLLLAALFLGIHAVPAQQTTAAARPNIVLIVMDDLGYGDIGSYGAPDAKTPNIDRIAREGVKLTDFYANHANCSPTRAGLITGRYQQRYDIEWPLGTFPADSGRGLLPAETSLPQLLRSAGYATALIGKWHLGWQPQYHPRRHGFDEFWGFLGGYIDYYNNKGEWNRHDVFHNDSTVHVSGYITDEITERARAFIEAKRSQPFFLEVSYNATHWPFQRPGLPPAARVKSHLVRDGTREDYVAMLESADRGVGVLLAAIDRLNLTGNTLVIFTSDNGGEWLSRNAPLFHRKSTLWEGGIRVPALLRWPARLPAGSVSRQVGITMDLTASIIAAAGVKVPASYLPEGVDLIPLLADHRVVERTLFWRMSSPARTQRAVRRGQWKYLRDVTHEFLFDLDADVGERNDLAQRHPQLVAELRKLSVEWNADVDSNRVALGRKN